MAKKAEQVVPEIIDSVEGLNAKMAAMREAQKVFATYTQEQVDKIFFAAASAANKMRIPLAKMAVEETGMGIVEDKVIKNNYAAEYIYNAYKNTKTVGVIEEDKEYGIKKIAEPIGLIAAGHAKEVVGVELNKDAVKDAILNAKENQIRNVRFFQGDAGEFMEAMAAEGNSMDVLFMDPPRAGSDEKFMASAVKMGPEKIVYISCNPETLARDLKYLTKKGYQVKKIQPVEMFAFTEHVETVCLLSKKCPV